MFAPRQVREESIRIDNPAGIHGRPASEIAQLVNKTPDTQVTLSFEGRSADAKSIFDILILGARPGAEVLVRVEGPRPDEVMQSIAHILKTDDSH